MTRDDLVGALSAHRAIIREADEWRPLAEHVLALLAAEREACATLIESACGPGHGCGRWETAGGTTCEAAAAIRARNQGGG